MAERGAKPAHSHQEQPWQLPREQPEQPFEEAELTKRSPALHPKTENLFSNFFEPQAGQSIEGLLPLTNLSKSAPQDLQVYSKTGKALHLLSKSIKRASGGPSPNPPKTSGSQYP